MWFRIPDYVGRIPRAKITRGWACIAHLIFGQEVSEENIFNESANQKQASSLVAMLSFWSEQNEILYYGPSTDAPYGILIHLAKRFQRWRSANQKQELSMFKIPWNSKFWNFILKVLNSMWSWSKYHAQIKVFLVLLRTVEVNKGFKIPWQTWISNLWWGFKFHKVGTEYQVQRELEAPRSL